MLPMIIKVVLIEKAFANSQLEVSQMDPLGIVGEPNASLVLHTILAAVDRKTIQAEITPTHGDLDGVVEVGNAVVAAQE